MQNTRFTQVAYPGSDEYYAIWDHEMNDYVRALGNEGFIFGGFTELEADTMIEALLNGRQEHAGSR